MVPSKLLSFKVGVNMQEIFIDYLVLVEMKNGEIYLYHPSLGRYSHHRNLSDYLTYYQVENEENRYHSLNFREISNHPIIKKILAKYRTINSISIRSRFDPVTDRKRFDFHTGWVTAFTS